MSGYQERNEKIKIAQVLNTHGVRGEVKAVPLSDFAERYYSLKDVYVERNNSFQVCTVQSVRWNKNNLLIKFEGIDNPEQAALLKNKYLMIDIEDTVPLPEDNYYLFEIVGLDVFDEDGNKLGKIQDVLQTSANDVYVVQGDNDKEILIPALKKLVRSIDIEKNTMIVELPSGLLDKEV